MVAAYPGHIWAYDFVEDALADGTPLRVLTVMDEFTRRALVTRVARSIKAVDVVTELERLAQVHGAPQFMRSDNGPEFIAAEPANNFETLSSGN